MIDSYVKKLVDNLPVKQESVEKLDVVLNSGAFNGSYLAGVLSFLKEMERRSYVQVDRISGCSVGAIGGLLYCIDGLDFIPKLYESMKSHFKDHFCLEILKHLREQLDQEKRLPDDLCDRVNGKLFVCYYDVKRNKKVVRSVYKNTDDIMETIIKSCYVPYFIDHELVYKGRFMDGINPYIFPREKDKKILYTELLSLDKLSRCFTVRNETNNFQRILEGLLDVHNFYVKQSSTSMCSYVDEWSLNQQIYYSLKVIIERVIVNMVQWIQCLKQYIPSEMHDHLLTHLARRVCFDVFSVLIERYCL